MAFVLAGMSAWALPRQTFELAHVEARGEQKPLKFPVAGNLDPARGGLSCWVRLDPTEGNPPEYRNVLSMPFKGRRGGTGALWFWIHRGRPRADFSDDRDSYLQNHGLVKEETWVHLVYNWDRSEGVGLFADGAGGMRKSDSSNLIKAARESLAAPRFSHLAELKHFVIGSRNGRERLGGVIEDLRIIDWRCRTVADFLGRTYFYAVNASDAPRKERFAFPAGTVDAVTGKGLDGLAEIELDAYGLRSFVKTTPFPASESATRP